MAVRFDATGENYTSTATPPSGSYTVLCWAFVVDRNAIATLWSSDSSTSNYHYVQTDSDGTTMRAWNGDGSSIAGPNVTASTWYRFALVVSGTTATLYWGTATGALSSASDATWPAMSPTPTTMRIGSSPFANEWLNGRIAAFEHYSAALTVAELEAEFAQYRPRRTANLVRWHPFLRAETADYGGSGNTLSGGSGTTTEDGPPIPWMRTWPRVYIPPASAGQSVALGTATETDAALALGRAKTRALSAATETDTAVAVTRRKTRAVAVALETDAALPLGRAKTKTLGVAVEVDTAVAISGAKQRTIGTAVETDAAPTVSRSKLRALGAALETDTAQPVGRRKTKLVGTVTELDSALTIGTGNATPINPALETDDALPVARRKTRALGTAAEIDTAPGLGRTKHRTVAAALEVDVARPLIVSRAKLLGIAVDLSTALTIGQPKRALLGTAVELDIALPIIGGQSSDIALLVTAGQVRTVWAARTAACWETDAVTTRWGAIVRARVSVLSKEPLDVPLTEYPANPTGDTVQVAIKLPDVNPDSGDWKSAAWVSTSTPYIARISVGPGSAIGALAPGRYVAWLRIAHSPDDIIKPAAGYVTIY